MKEFLYLGYLLSISHSYIDYPCDNYLETFETLTPECIVKLNNFQNELNDYLCHPLLYSLLHVKEKRNLVTHVKQVKKNDSEIHKMAVY